MSVARRLRRIDMRPSRGSRERLRTTRRGRRSRGKRERGIALVIVMSAIALLAVFVTDMHESTGTAFAVANSQKEQLQAEYQAKSAINLTRLLIANEPQIRQTIAPLFQMMVGRPPPQIPVWQMATEILAPFCNYDEAVGTAGAVGVDLSQGQGLADNPATCEIVAIAENSMINVNDPLARDGDQARRGSAMQLFALMGGYASPSPYDPLFAQTDADGQTTTRLDVISAVIDWWDADQQRTIFDPGANTVDVAGAEDDTYSRLVDSYKIKNAPYDSLEELRLIRGIGDDFWATFIEPNPDDPLSRNVTVYGSGAVNVNTAPAAVILARLCSFVDTVTLCADPIEQAKFVQLVTTMRSLFPIPLFTRPDDFLTFVEGGGSGRDLYPTLLSLLGPDNPLVFTPISIPQEARTEIRRSFLTGASIIFVQATGFAGRSQVTIKSVLNFHNRWTPPPPNSGSLPPTGIFHHYRID